MSRNWAPALLVFLALSLGCSGGGSSPVVTTPVGAYTLQSVDGHSLPAVVFDDIVRFGEDPPFRMQIVAVSGSLRLTSEGRYEQELLHRALADGVPIANDRYGDHGVWSESTAALHFESDYLQNVRFNGTYGGRQLTVRQDFTALRPPAAYVYGR